MAESPHPPYIPLRTIVFQAGKFSRQSILMPNRGCLLWHTYQWDEPRWVGTAQRLFVQYARCTKCGKAKAREVLL